MTRGIGNSWSLYRNLQANRGIILEEIELKLKMPRVFHIYFWLIIKKTDDLLLFQVQVLPLCYMPKFFLVLNMSAMGTLLRSWKSI